MDLTNISDIQKLSTEQLWLLAKQWTPDQWRSEIDKLTPDQIHSIIPAATEEQDPTQWRLKTRAIIESLKHAHQLEAAGRIFSLAQIHEIMTAAAADKGPILEKLFPLFIGMPHPIFFELLRQSSSEQLTILKQQSITEPIQHHLTLLVQELNADMAKCALRFTSKEAEFETLDLSEIETAQISEEERKIEELRESCSLIQFITAKALSVAWNTNRTDLIDKLSKLKEQSQRSLQTAVGNPRSATTEPSGLYFILEKRLHSVFCNNDSSEIDALQNEEPVTEALVKFSVWYLHDYLEIGLLPHLENATDLELNLQTHSENEPLKYREKLFATVEKNLCLLGLSTLADLKHEKIYSKKALKDFIKAHQGKITSNS